MGADVYRAFPAAHRVYDLADHALGFSLSRLCFEGPEETLRETINTQPALVATSLALLAALQEAAGSVPTDTGEPALTAPLQPAFTAGHSVGEYAAVAAAGALGIEDALRLVRERGRLMHAEGTACPSGMAAVLGMDVATLEALCAEATEQSRAALDQNETHPGAGRVVVANDNAPGQIVISGARPALDRAMELARERGARRVVPLAVSGAFHSPVMSPAAQGLAHAVNAAPFVMRTCQSSRTSRRCHSRWPEICGRSWRSRSNRRYNGRGRLSISLRRVSRHLSRLALGRCSPDSSSVLPEARQRSRSALPPM